MVCVCELVYGVKCLGKCLHVCVCVSKENDRIKYIDSRWSYEELLSKLGLIKLEK